MVKLRTFLAKLLGLKGTVLNTGLTEEQIRSRIDELETEKEIIIEELEERKKDYEEALKVADKNPKQRESILSNAKQIKDDIKHLKEKKSDYAHQIQAWKYIINTYELEEINENDLQEIDQKKVRKAMRSIQEKRKDTQKTTKTVKKGAEKARNAGSSEDLSEIREDMKKVTSSSTEEIHFEIPESNGDTASDNDELMEIEQEIKNMEQHVN